VLHRKTSRPRFSWSDRAFLSLVAQLLPRYRWTSFLVAPATILEWQRRIIRRRWTYPKRPGRPPLGHQTVEIICRLARENPRWGYLRIVGEMKKLGVVVSATAVRRVLRQHGLGPAPRRSGPSWSEFIQSQAKSMLATDFFHVDTVFGQRFYGLFVIEVGTRAVRLLGVRTNPNAVWMAQMGRNLVFDLHEANRQVRFFVRDRDTKFTAAFDEILRTESITTIRTPVQAPRANAYAERWIESLRAECLDYLLIVTQVQAERVLRAYVAHYNRGRPHRGLSLEVPKPSFTGPPVGRVERHDVLGGLIHEYRRAA